MNKQIVTLIKQCIENLPRDNGEEGFENVTAQSSLFGKDGLLDSIGLVSLVVAVEHAIEDEFGIVLSLADERALSRRNSPYRTIASLADYAAELIQAEN